MNNKGCEITLINRNEMTASGFPVLGKTEHVKIVYPTDQINYMVGDSSIPVMWLNVRSVTDAIKYYSKFYPMFTQDIREQLAYDSFRRKMMAEVEEARNKEELRAAKSMTTVKEEIAQLIRDLDNVRAGK